MVRNRVFHEQVSDVKEGATMVWIAAVFACITLTAIGLLHAYWGFGGHTALVGTMPTAGGKSIFHPGKFWTFVVASGLFLMSMTVAIRMGWVPVPALRELSRIGVWTMAAIFTVRQPETSGMWDSSRRFATHGSQNWIRLYTRRYAYCWRLRSRSSLCQGTRKLTREVGILETRDHRIRPIEALD